MISAEQVVALYNRRVGDAGPQQQVLRQITDLYQGDIVVPMPELGANELPAIPNIARAGIDQIGQRISSVFPEMSVSPSGPSKQSVRRASERRRAFYAFHEQNRTSRLLKRRARYLMGYASAPVKIVPDFAIEMPRWQVKSPIGMYAAPSGDADQMVPDDCIFASTQSMAWLQHRFPNDWGKIYNAKTDSPSTAIDLIEYVDPDCMWLIAARRGTQSGNDWDAHSAILRNETHIAVSQVALVCAPNRTGITPVVIPGQITLGARKSSYHQIIGMYQAAAEMDAWARHATAKGINSTEWLVGYQGDEPELVQAADPLNGIVGIVKGGNLETRTVAPQFAARAAVSDMERAQRLTAQLPAELGGEAATNVRTGRRGDQLLSAVLDFPVQEAHHLFEESIERENEIAALTDLRYFRNVPKVYAVNWEGEKGDLAYVPGDLWTRGDAKGTPATSSKVSFFAAGADAGDRIISLGQRMGMGTISKETTMRHDPLVDDVEGEMRRITVEEIDRAFLTKIQQLASDPASPVTAHDIASLKTHVMKGLALEEAWVKVEEEIQKRQQEAQEAAAQQQGAPMGPESLEPGGAPPMDPSIGAPPESVGNLSSLLNGLRSQSVFTTPQG